MGWGRGWEVGLNREMWAQRRAYEQAAEILAKEHGDKHQPGERTDLCPICIASAEKERRAHSRLD
jgi:hypothetical protein